MIWRVFPGIDLTNNVVDTTFHGRALWPHPDFDGDGVEDLLSMAGGGEELPDPRMGAFDLISSSSGEILAGGEFGAWGAWEFFTLPGSPGEAPQLVSYFLRGKGATHLLVHSWAIQEGEAGAKFVSTPRAAIPLPEGAVGKHTYWAGPKLLRTQDPRLAYLACSVEYKRCLLQLSGDLLAPTLSMAWPRADRPWLPEALREVDYHWAVLPDLDSDGFDELAVGPADAPSERSEQPRTSGVASQPEPMAGLLVLSGKDFYVKRALALPGFGRGDVVAVCAGVRDAQVPAGQPSPPGEIRSSTPDFSLFAHCASMQRGSNASTLFRIDPRSGELDGTLTTRALSSKAKQVGGAWDLGSKVSMDVSLLYVASPLPALIFGDAQNGVSGAAACIDPSSGDVRWTARGRSWGEILIGDYNFGATSCWLRAESGPGLVAIASPYIRGGQASISFFGLLDGICRVRIDCHGR